MLNGAQTSRKTQIFTSDQFRFSQGYPISIAIHAIIHKEPLWQQRYVMLATYMASPNNLQPNN